MTDIALYPDLYNYSGNSLRKWRRARARIKAGYTTARQRIVCAGDSETLGLDPGNGSYADAAGHSWPKYLTDALNTAGIPAQRDGFFGDGASGPVSNFDARVSLGAGWGSGTGSSIGGNVFYNTTTTNAIQFTPANSFDKVRVYSLDQSGGGSYTFDVGGSVIATVNQNNGTPGVYYHEFGTSGSTVRVKRVSGSVRIVGIETWTNGTPRIMVCNMGWSGSTAEGWSRTTYPSDPANLLNSSAPAYFDAQLTIIGLGANNMTQGLTDTDYATAMQTIIDNAKTTGDALIVAPAPIDPTYASATQVQQDAILAAMYDRAVANDVPVYDIYKRWDSYATSNPLGYYGDVVHPSRLVGYPDIAQGLATILTMV